MLGRRRSREGLVQEKRVDRNGVERTVWVRPPAPEFTAEFPPHKRSVINSIDGWSANGWMRMIRDADADVYDVAWKATDEELRARGLLVPVTEIGFRQASDDERSRAEDAAIHADWGYTTHIDPASISVVTGGENLRLDVLAFYLREEAPDGVLDSDEVADGIRLVRFEDDTHYVVDGKHRLAAGIIRGERDLEVSVADAE